MRTLKLARALALIALATLTMAMAIPAPAAHAANQAASAEIADQATAHAPSAEIAANAADQATANAATAATGSFECEYYDWISWGYFWLGPKNVMGVEFCAAYISDADGNIRATWTGKTR